MPGRFIFVAAKKSGKADSKARGSACRGGSSSFTRASRVSSRSRRAGQQFALYEAGSDMTAMISDSSSRPHGNGKPSARSAGAQR